MRNQCSKVLLWNIFVQHLDSCCLILFVFIALFLVFLFLLINRLMSSCISLACFLLAFNWATVKCLISGSSLFPLLWQQNSINLIIGKISKSQNAWRKENGTGKDVCRSKKSIQILVFTNFQYNWRRSWNFWTVAFINVIVKLSRIVIAKTKYIQYIRVANLFLAVPSGTSGALSVPGSNMINIRPYITFPNLCR